MFTDPTHADRAAWAQAALDGFAASHNSGGGTVTDIQDLITDLLHLARQEGGADASDILRRALSNYEAELAEEAVL